MRVIYKKSIWVIAGVLLLVSSIKTDVRAFSKSRVMIEDYRLEGDILKGGEETVLTMTVKNASDNSTAQNILISGQGQDNLVYPVYGSSNQMYVEQLGPGESEEVSIRLRAVEGIRYDSVSYAVNLMFSDETYSDNYTSAILQLPVSRESILVVNDYSAPESAYQNVKARISASFSNQGIGDMYNVVMHVEGVDGDKELDGLSVDALAGGESSFVETYISFSEIGRQDIKVYFTYDDEQGNQVVSEDKHFTITVNEPRNSEVAGNEALKQGGTVQESELQNVEEVAQLELVRGILIAVICVISLGILVRYRRKKNR
ncbi:MAG: hypothetical protein K6G30_14105 [Acetatifactor sp.]|nr:hypothetical protein [Acetatifactor sp.]